MANFDYRKTPNAIRPASPKPGVNLFYTKIDFSDRTMVAADTLELMPIKDGWIITDSYYRFSTASTSTGTADLGTAAGGQQIAAAVDVDGALTAWTVGTITEEGAAVSEVTADGFIYFECLGQPITDGIFELMIEVIIAPGDDGL